MNSRRLLNLLTLYALFLICLISFLLGRTYISSQWSPETLVTIQLRHVIRHKSLPPVAQPHTRIKTSSAVVPLDEVQEVRKGYDDYAWHPDRLGSGIGKEFQVTPMPWQLKWNKTLTNPLVRSNSAKWKTKTILLYDSFNWWKFNGKLDCPLIPTLKCKMIQNPGNGEGQSNPEIAPQIAQDLDGVIFVRDFAHKADAVTLSKDAVNVTAIYFTLEPPYGEYIDVQLNPWRTYFASYWRGSDIYAPYFRWKYYDPRVTAKPPARNYAEGRTKMAVIVVSNCAAANDRLELVRKLQKYLPVDVHGNCAASRLHNSRCGEDCFDKLKEDYKFYLAFENSNCRDYVTEKFHWNALKHDMVPVVLGAHPEDYKAIAPAHSYIHVEDFQSVKALADYLLLLDGNDTLYNEYFSWKETGDFVPMNFLCEACAFVHAKTNEEFNYFETDETRRSYLNSEDTYADAMFEWSATNNMLCLGKDEWYWNPPAD